MRHLVGYFLVSSALIGCSLSTVGSMDPKDGAKCDQSMETKTAADGCTVCTCDGETWSCSSDACTAGCSEGDKKVAEDGCNQCACDADGKWDCTSDLKCGEGCKAGDTSVSADGCTTCLCAGDGTWDCEVDDNCGSMVECKPGETKLSDGGCYECTCSADGLWACPDVVCEKCKVGEETHNDCYDCVCNELGTWSCSGFFDGNCGAMECTPGESRTDDGCNTCTCTDEGQWSCTLVDCGATCPPPAMAPAEGCAAEPTFARDPFSSLCCEYASLCEAPQWKLFDSLDACKAEVTVICEANRSDCDGDPSNGCEVDILTSPESCGFCGLRCTSPTGEPGKCDMGRCVDMPKPTCRYQGVDYNVGSSFPSRDGCNTCGCVDTGSGSDIACTDEACMCNPSAEGYREYADIEPEKCSALDFECPDNTRKFSNECGCGCEQGVECPSYYKCLPDGSDMEQCTSLPKTCPYTEILLPL
jgi:hypothetical protein